MTLQIDLTTQVEAWLNAEARQHGLLPVDFARRVLEERANAPIALPAYKSAQERIRAMDALAEASNDRPHVPDAAFDRETIYEDNRLLSS